MTGLKPRRSPLLFLSFFLLPLIFSVCALPGSALANQEKAGTTAEANIESDLERRLSMAEAQHEIALLLIKDGQYDKVFPEMKKIFELGLPSKYEESILQSVAVIANQLAERRQHGVAHQVLDEASRFLKLDSNKVKALKLKAYVLKDEGKFQEAIDTFRKAIEMERQKPR